jgi:hypothetical protein
MCIHRQISLIVPVTVIDSRYILTQEYQPKPNKRDRSYEDVDELMNRLESAGRMHEDLEKKERAKSITEEEAVKEKEILAQIDNNLRQRKKRVLDEIIFPSMANLVVFLERIQDSPRLSKRFDENVRRLFLAKSVRSKRTEHIFSRFLKASCFTTVTREGRPVQDFRLVLIYIMQRTVLQKMHVLGPRKFDDPFFWEKTLLPDMERAAAWMGEIGHAARMKEQVEEGRRKERQWDSEKTKQKKKSERVKWTVSF